MTILSAIVFAASATLFLLALIIAGQDTLARHRAALGRALRPAAGNPTTAQPRPDRLIEGPGRIYLRSVA